MTDFERLKSELKKTFPHAKIDIENPANPKGVWHLDLHHGEKAVNVMWKVARGFGVTDISPGTEHGLGEGPEHTSNTVKQTVEKIQELLEA